MKQEANLAGTIFGLGMSQRVDVNGDPDLGWLLYLYDQNSSTPVTAYQDTALSVALPWPVEADSNGMMPPFWLADGSYRVRGTSSDGSRVFFDVASVLALGASSGSAPSGSVDPNTIFATGDVMFQPISGARSGWVRENGRTIGSATSGASERANSDCQALFEFLWNNYADAKCPVVGGRGGSAASDWAANKKITLIDMRGVGPIGLDDMGNSAAGNFTGVPFVDGDETTAASICGANTHALTEAELAEHTHTATQASHSHSYTSAVSTGVGGTGAGSLASPSGATTGTAQPTITVANTGSGDAHNNVGLSITGTWYRKL